MPICLYEPLSMFALCPAEPFHAANTALAEDQFVPAAMFSPAPCGYPQSIALVDGERPSESVCEKYFFAPISPPIHVDARFRFVLIESAESPFCARYVLIRPRNACSSASTLLSLTVQLVRASARPSK